MDGTYKTNISNYSLYLIVSMDMGLKTRIIAGALLRNEDNETIGEFIRLFKKYNPCHVEINKIVIDKDPAEIKAVEELLPNAEIILCYFHNLASIELKINEPFAKKNQMLNLIRTMSILPDEKLFNQNLDNLKQISNDAFWNYFVKNWLSVRNLWAGYAINYISCYGTNTNGRIEGKIMD